MDIFVPENQDKAKELVKRYVWEPNLFCRDILQVNLDSWQKRAFQKLLEKNYLAIRSGSGVGKSFLMSCATYWYLFTHPFSKVPSTAPSQHQLNDVLWGEHFTRLSNSPVLNGMMEWTQTRVGVKGYLPSWYAVARTAQVKPGSEVAEGLQGFHAEEYLMFVIDEGSGVPEAIFPAVEGAMTNENAMSIMAGNPTRRSGYFYDTFNNPVISAMYANMHVSCYDSPRVSKRYIQMMEERYGKDHPVFLIKVLGEFPEADSDFLIPPAFIEQMQNNSEMDTSAFAIEIGVDIGRTGSPSVLCVRQGTKVLKWDEKHKPGKVTDTDEQVKWISEYILEFDPQYVKIDAVGLGAGVYDGLKVLWGDRIVPVIGNASPADEFRDRYLNLRSQGCWELRNLIPHLYCKRWPERVITEMADIRTKIANKLKIESKDDMRARAMKSPDYFDSLMYAYLNADDCLHIKPVVYTFPTQIAPTADELKKSSIADLALSNQSTLSKFRRAFRAVI